MPRLVFFDLETNGFQDDCEILQIGARAYKSNYRDFNEYIQPRGTIPHVVTRVNGLFLNRRGQLAWKNQHGSQVINDARPAEEVLWDFYNWIGHGQCLLVAHNAKRFDAKVLMRHFEAYQVPSSNLTFADSLQLARNKLPSLRKHKLEDLQEFYEIENKDQHDALSDANTLRYIVFVMLEGEFETEKQCASAIQRSVDTFYY